MKKIWILFAVLVSLLPAVLFAYEPTSEDKTALAQLKTQIREVSQEDRRVLWHFYEQMRDLQPYFIQDEQKNYYLTHMRDYLYELFLAKKAQAKQETIEQKKAFLNSYLDQLNNSKEADPNCIWWYNSMDNLSYAYNLPTALTLAVWYRESSCSYGLPKNKNGPFQIRKKDYGVGEISKDLFWQTIKDFLEFSHNKISRHNRVNPEDELQIKMDYQNRSYEDLYKFAALYNGLSGNTVYGEIAPANEKYFFERYGENYPDGKKNGIFPMFLRNIEREIQQQEIEQAQAEQAAQLAAQQVQQEAQLAEQAAQQL